MTDIVERLRRERDEMLLMEASQLLYEAADEIERLNAKLDESEEVAYAHYIAMLKEKDAEIERLQSALQDCVAAIKDVQDHWSDSGSFTHNRLLTPLLVHDDTIRGTG